MTQPKATKSRRGGVRPGAGSKPKNKAKERVTVCLSQEAKEALKLLGNGNLSQGVEIGASIAAETNADKFFRRSRLSEKCKLLLELALEDPDLLKSKEVRHRIIDVLCEMEVLGFESDFLECVAEGVIKLEGGAYIV